MINVELGESAVEVSRSPKITDDTNLSALSIKDMFSLLLRKLTYDESVELEAQEQISIEKMKMIGSLNNLFTNALRIMNDKRKNSVTLNVSSLYLPYMDEVINNKTGLGRFYEFNIKRDTSIPVGVPHKFLVTIKKKE